MKKNLVFLCLAAAATAGAQDVTFRVKAYCQGFYSEAEHHLRAVADPVIHPALCDTAVLMLIDSATSQNLLCISSLIDTSGQGEFIIPSAYRGSAYVLGICFRNTLHQYSSMAVTVDDNSPGFDFTDPANNSGITDQAGGNAKALSGDLNRDGYIDAFDFTTLDAAMSEHANGYVVSDLNGDGSVNAADLALFNANSLLAAADLWPDNCLPVFTASVNRPRNEPSRVFPNPFNDHLRLILGEGVHEATVTVTDAIGRVCMHSTCSTDTPDLRAENLRPGAYQLCIQTGKSTEHFPLIKTDK